MLLIALGLALIFGGANEYRGEPVSASSAALAGFGFAALGTVLAIKGYGPKQGPRAGRRRRHESS